MKHSIAAVQQLGFDETCVLHIVALPRDTHSGSNAFHCAPSTLVDCGLFAGLSSHVRHMTNDERSRSSRRAKTSQLSLLN